MKPEGAKKTQSTKQILCCHNGERYHADHIRLQFGQAMLAAGTVILINEGRKAIEDIVVGDYVWACDEETGEKSLRRVTETYVNQTSELVHVFVGGEEIVTTPTHPFYSPVKGWTDAAQLRAGDQVYYVSSIGVLVLPMRPVLLSCDGQSFVC